MATLTAGPTRQRFLLASLLLVSCASAKVIRPAAEMAVYNVGRVTVAAIQAKRCGDPDGEYRTISESMVDPGRWITIPQQEGCVDLRALSRSGAMLGLQDNLRMIPGSSWTIR